MVYGSYNYCLFQIPLHLGRNKSLRRISSLVNVITICRIDQAKSITPVHQKVLGKSVSPQI